MTQDRISPEKRQGCASCVVPSRKNRNEKVVLIFGGEDESQCFSDCWMFEPGSETLVWLGHAPAWFTPRSYHSATYIDGLVWLIGGMNRFTKDPKEQIVADSVWCFDVGTQSFFHIPLKSQQLTVRTAHGACVNPVCPTSILIFGGYGYKESKNLCGSTRKKSKKMCSTKGEWKNDLVLLDTARRVCSVQETKHPPQSRGYMTFDTLGDFCVALFGRSGPNRLVGEGDYIAMYDPRKEDWVEPRVEGTFTAALRHSHRVSAYNDDSIIIYGGNLERNLNSRSQCPPGNDAVSLLRYEQHKKAFSWHSVLFTKGQLCCRFSHVQECLDDSLYIIGGYSTGFDGESRHYPSNIKKIVFGKQEAQECNIGVGEVSIVDVSFIAARIEMEQSKMIEIDRDTHHIEDSMLPEANETAISETEEEHSAWHKTNCMASTLNQVRGQTRSVNFEEELKISDQKWKNASKNCAYWKQVAEEEREKYQNATSLLLRKEAAYADMNILVKDLRNHIGTLESEIKTAKADLQGMVIKIEQTKENMRKDREATYKELRQKLDQRAEQCKQTGEAYKNLKNETDTIIQSLNAENKVLQIDLENIKRQYDCLLNDFNESRRQHGELEQMLSKHHEQQKAKDAHCKELMQQVQHLSNVVDKVHTLMHNMNESN